MVEEQAVLDVPKEDVPKEVPVEMVMSSDARTELLKSRIALFEEFERHKTFTDANTTVVKSQHDVLEKECQDWAAVPENVERQKQWVTRATALGKKIGGLFEHEFTGPVENMFRKAMTNRQIRSQTVVVFDPSNPKTPARYAGPHGWRSTPSITIGKHGYGLRYNVQSRMLGDFRDVVFFMAHADYVAASLRDLKLESEAKLVEELHGLFGFLKNIREAGNGAAVRVPLVKPIPVWIAAYGGGVDVFVADEFEISSNSWYGRVWLCKGRKSVDVREDFYKHSSFNEDYVFYRELEPQFEELLSRADAVVKTFPDVKELIVRVEEALSKLLMFASV